MCVMYALQYTWTDLSILHPENFSSNTSLGTQLCPTPCFSYEKQSAQSRSFTPAKNIPVALPNFPIEIWSQYVRGSWVMIGHRHIPVEITLQTQLVYKCF